MANLAELFRQREYKTWWRFFRWKVKNSVQRSFIHYVERLGIHKYAAWRKKQSWVTRMVTTDPGKIRFGFIILPSLCKADVERTRLALKQLSYPHWSVWELDTHQEEGQLSLDPLHSFQNLLNDFHKDLKVFTESCGVDYVSFIRAGDTFDTDYLDLLNQNLGEENYAAIYTDEDQFDPFTARFSHPWLKPDPSPALFYSINYLYNAFFHRGLIDQLPGADYLPEEMVAQLAWNAFHGQRPLKHAVGIIYHRSSNNKLVGEHLAHLTGLQLNLAQSGLEQLRVDEENSHVSWAVRDDLVSIIIPTHNRSERLVCMLDGLRARTAYTHYEIILVDNQSDETGIDAVYEKLTADPRIQVLRVDEPFNYSRYNNIGARAATGKMLVFLNNDMEITQEDWLIELVMWAQRPRVGVVGARLMYPNGRIQHAGVVLGLVGSAGHVFIGEPPQHSGPHGTALEYRNYLAVTGACMAMRTVVFHILGGFDEGYQLTFSDIALCLKAVELDYQVVYNPFACLVHDEGGSRGDFIPDGDIIRMADEFAPWLKRGDPYFNPLLSRMVATPALRRSHEEDPLARLGLIKTLAEFQSKSDTGQA